MLFSFAFCSSVISKPSLKPVKFFLAICYIFPTFKISKKSLGFFFLPFPPPRFVAVSAVPVHLWEKQNQPEPCLMVKSSSRKRAPKAWLCVGPAETGPHVYVLRRTFSGSFPTTPVLFPLMVFAVKHDFLDQFILLPQKPTKSSSFHQG